MPLVELSTALVAAGSGIVVPFVNKVLEKTASRVGDSFDAQLVTLFTKAHDFLTASGHEANPVEPKIIAPIVQAARLETDPDLIDKWAALLANAASGQVDILVQPSFAEVLRQLTPTQVRILDRIYQQVDPSIEAGEDWQPGIEVSAIREELQLTFFDFQLCMGNLLRLSLCTEYEAKNAATLGKVAPGTKKVDPTIFGYAFVKACTPPQLTV
ncbi:Abi-alpha family protein [Hymenobacter sp. GOD-10R]|uniref:Abi-alpha family protein n=1 Tax=Hymenobacter sp. GOD-10R TaxID=3093922 RepID=UPI002D77BE38|nr:Abi-alpha family protein [Hymenobacter sp. GOD-10R]WRQ27349.1 Abi-alpha family protein [Hymenobacter sp. GOD-10R]